MITSSDLYSTNYCLTFDVAVAVVIDHVVVVVVGDDDATKTFLFRTICSNLQLLDNHHIQIFGA